MVSYELDIARISRLIHSSSSSFERERPVFGVCVSQSGTLDLCKIHSVGLHLSSRHRRALLVALCLDGYCVLPCS